MPGSDSDEDIDDAEFDNDGEEDIDQEIFEAMEAGVEDATDGDPVGSANDPSIVQDTADCPAIGIS